MLVSTNLEGFFFITQLAVKQMLSQGTGGSVTSRSRPPLCPAPHRWSLRLRFRCSPRAGLNAITHLSLASEYAKNNIRFNAVAPGAVDTPIVKGNIPKDFLMTLSPMWRDFRREGHRRCCDLSNRSSPRNRRGVLHVDAAACTSANGNRRNLRWGARSHSDRPRGKIHRAARPGRSIVGSTRGRIPC